MKSIKPGRGPSAMGAFGSVIAIIFGIGWTIVAFNITRDSSFGIFGKLFPFFGGLFILVGIVQLAYNLKNTVSKDRMSIVDITEGVEERDPFGLRGGGSTSTGEPRAASVEDRLNRLEALRAAGSITESEYKVHRSRILEEI